MKYIKITVVAVFAFCVLSVNAFALNTSTYADVASTSTNSQNLINYAINYKSFKDSDFVVFQSAQYSYYIVWGDLKYNGASVSSDKVEYIQYYRQGSGYDYVYQYSYGADDAFTLSVNNVVVSNVEGLGMSSNLYRDYDYYRSYELNTILFGGALLVIMILTFRGVNK